MATEKLEIDVIVNGKKARVELDKVEKSTGEIGKTTKETSSVMSASWLKIGAAVASVTAVMGVAIKKSLDLSKATAGMSDEMKLYVQEVSNATGATQDMIAGFVKSGQTANLTTGVIKKITEQAIALGRAYPHESAESFHDNLVMLNKTGEAQGFIVDILEQKYGQIDLKLIPLAEKLKTVEEATIGVSKSFEKTAGSKIDQILTKAGNALTKFGDIAVGMLNKFGWIDTVNDGLSKMLRSMKEINEYSIKDVNAELLKLNDALVKAKKLEAEAPLTSMNPFTTTKGVARVKRRNIEIEINMLNKRKAILEEGAKEEAKQAEENTKNTQTKIDNIRAAEEAAIAAKKAEAEAEADAKRAFEEAEREKQRAIEKTLAVQDMYVQEMSAGITKFIMDGKFKFKDMLRQWVADLIQSNISSLLKNLLGFATGGGGLLSGIASLFGFHTGTAKVLHAGGYMNMPSHHSGSMRSDERIAKLQVGEAVVNRAGANINKSAIARMNRGEKVDSGTTRVTTAEINFNVQAIDSAGFNNYLVTNRGTIENIINNSLSTNGSVRQTIKQVV